MFSVIFVGNLRFVGYIGYRVRGRGFIRVGFYFGFYFVLRIIRFFKEFLWAFKFIIGFMFSRSIGVLWGGDFDGWNCLLVRYFCDFVVIDNCGLEF